MQTGAISLMDGNALQLRASAAVNQADFGRALADAKQTKDADKAQQAAQQFVATTLVFPLLKEMHNDPFRTEMFHGGFGEDAFQSQLDQVIADRIVKRTNLPIVNVIKQHLTHNGLNTYG